MIEWDETKRQSNIAKHGLDFADVVRFQGQTALVVEDTRYNYGETRHQALGMLDGQLVMLVFTPRNQSLRVISLRPATAKEGTRYAAFRNPSPKTP